MKTIVVDIKVVDGEHEKIFPNHVLFYQPDLDPDRIKEELKNKYAIPVYRIKIIDYWDNIDEVQLRIIRESDGLCNEQARSDIRVLSEYSGFEELDPEPL